MYNTNDVCDIFNDKWCTQGYSRLSQDSRVRQVCVTVYITSVYITQYI